MPVRSRSPNGCRRRASSGPASSPDTSALSTSPARRRSVSSAIRRRRSSSATIVTAWCSVRRSNSVSAARSLAATSHACGSGSPPPAVALGAACARDRQRERAAVPVAAGSEAAARPAAGPLAQLRGERLDGRGLRRAVGRARGEQLPAAVEHHRRAADQRRERAGDAVEPALGEHDPLEALVRRQRPPQDRVLLVDQVAERLLGDGDERQLVRDLEQREPVLLGGRGERLGHRLVREPGAEAQAGQLVAGEPRDVLALAIGVGQLHPGGQQQLAAGEPRRRVLQLGDVHPADGMVQPGAPARGAELEIAKEVTESQHRSSTSAGAFADLHNTYRPARVRLDSRGCPSGRSCSSTSTASSRCSARAPSPAAACRRSSRASPTCSRAGRAPSSRRLAGTFECVWCTGWEDRAGTHLPHLLGLPAAGSTSCSPTAGGRGALEAARDRRLRRRRPARRLDRRRPRRSLPCLGGGATRSHAAGRRRTRPSGSPRRTRTPRTLGARPSAARLRLRAGRQPLPRRPSWVRRMAGPSPAPGSRISAVASLRERTPSLANDEERWLLTVLSAR